MYTINDLILLFFIYSFVGWLWETVYCSSKEGHFVYRGFLFGPYCPVYGFAVSSVLLFTQKFADNFVLLFLVGTVVSTVFEYLAGAFWKTSFISSFGTILNIPETSKDASPRSFHCFGASARLS